MSTTNIISQESSIGLILCRRIKLKLVKQQLSEIFLISYHKFLQFVVSIEHDSDHEATERIKAYEECIK